MNVILLPVQDEFGFSETDLQWVVNAYTLTLAGCLLFGGRAADLLSRKLVVIIGFIVTALASACGGLAPDGVLLIVARGAQGLGAAVLVPATLSILTSRLPAGPVRDKAIGLWCAASCAGGTLGMFFGGALAEFAGWRWVLLAKAPVALVGAVAAWKLLPRQRTSPDGRSLDIPGAVTASAGLIALVYGVAETHIHGWVSAYSLVPIAAGVVLLTVFIGIEHRFASSPLVPLSLFRHRRLALANVAAFLLGFAMPAMWFFVTLYLQRSLGYSPLEAGAAFVPMTIALTVASLRAEWLAARFGTGWVLAAGMAIFAAGTALFAIAPVHATYLGTIILPMIVTATGIGLAFVTSTGAATADADAADSGVAAGLVNTIRQVGSALGLAVLVVVAADGGAVAGASRAAATAGYQRGLLGAALAAAAGAGFAVALLPGTRTPPSRRAR